MARTARLAYDNVVLNAATLITASGSATGWPVSNLSNSARWLRWRSSTTTGNQNVDFDFVTNKDVTCVVIADVLIHVGGTVKAQQWSGGAWVDIGTFTVPTVNPTGMIALWFASINTQKIRVLFTNTGGLNSYVEIGAIFIGTYFQPAISLAPGYGITFVDPSIVGRSTGGQRSSDKRTPYFELRGDFNFEPETDRAAFYALNEACGVHTPFVLAINPDDPAYFVFYGRFDDPPAFDHVTLHRFSSSFQFSEDV
jgi:hypothetical protein